MPRQTTSVAGSNLDPLQIFNTPPIVAVPQRGVGGRIGGSGLFDALVPRLGGNGGIPTTTGPTPVNYNSIYTVPSEVSTNIRGTSAGITSAPTGMADIVARNAMLRSGGATPTSQLPQHYPPSPVSSFVFPTSPFVPGVGGVGGPGTVGYSPFSYQPPTGPASSTSDAAQWMSSLLGNNRYLESFAQNGNPARLNNPYLSLIAQNGLFAPPQGYLNELAATGLPVNLQNPFLGDIARNGLPTSLEGSYLQRWAENGQPVNALPAWQSYVDAMQRNIQSDQAGLMEMFNQSGGYQSTSFGNAAVDYMTQTAKDQNALLAQMGYQSLSDAMSRQFQAGGTYDALRTSLAEAAAQRRLQAGGTLDTLSWQALTDAANRRAQALGTQETLNFQAMQDAANRRLQAGSILDQLQFQGTSDARMREYGAAQALGQQAYGAGSQLTGYDFQSQMAQYQSAIQASMLAAQQASGLQGSALGQLGSYGNAATNQLLQNSLFGASNLFQGSQNALTQMFGNSSQVPAQLLSTFLAQQGQGIQGYQTLINSYLQNLGLGAQVGTTQYNTLQGQLGALYQEWLRTQPQYNPLLPYLFQAATGYVPTSQTSTPGFWDYFTNILGAGIGAAGSIIGGGMAGGVFSDERMKENVEHVGRIKDVDFYEYDYVGFPGRRIGVLAQEIAKQHPNVVMQTDDGTFLVDYTKLANELLLTGGVS